MVQTEFVDLEITLSILLSILFVLFIYAFRKILKWIKQETRCTRWGERWKTQEMFYGVGTRLWSILAHGFTSPATTIIGLPDCKYHLSLPFLSIYLYTYFSLRNWLCSSLLILVLYMLSLCFVLPDIWWFITSPPICRRSVQLTLIYRYIFQRISIYWVSNGLISVTCAEISQTRSFQAIWYPS